MGLRRTFWGRPWNATTKLLAPGRANEDYEAMRKLLLAGVLSLAASSASAVSRYEITNVTCETVQALIRAEGSVILVYRSTGILGLPIYDRYVQGQQFCMSGEVARGAGVPTADKKYCPVRKCVESEIFRAR
jgi:hypothetical protein